MKNKNKKGVSMYISWILLMLMAIILSALMYNWYTGRTEQYAERLTTESTKEVCTSVGINIKGACQDTQMLYINITNSLDIKIDQLVFNLVDLYDDVENKKYNLTLYPGETEKIKLLKQGTLKQIEVVPATTIDNVNYPCSNRKVFKYKIAQC
jgi:FlaG/FlaF family flagellin (archaellin)